MIPQKFLWLQRGRKSPWISYWGPKRKGSSTPTIHFQGRTVKTLGVQTFHTFSFREYETCLGLGIPIYKQTFICHWKMGKGGRLKEYELPWITSVPNSNTPEIWQIDVWSRFDGRMLKDVPTKHGICFLTSWWFQPIWKIWSSNWIISPIFGVKIKQYLSCHHPVHVWNSHEFQR